MAAAGVTLSTGHHSRCVQLLSCSPALHESRESLTRTQGAPLRRVSSIRYADHSARSVALLAENGVMAFKEAITCFGALDHATRWRVDAETVPMRAYVTSSDDAREAPCERATTSRHVVWASSRLAAHERREGLCARTASRRRSRGGARMKAGDACASLQAPRLLRWQRSRQRVARWSPSFRRGRTKQIARARTVAPLPLP